MFVIAVRSFGIISAGALPGAGAILFAAPSVIVSGIQILAAVGEAQRIILLILDYSEIFFRTWNSNSGSGRWSCNSCKLFTSILHCEVRPMLSSWSRPEGKDCLPKIVLISPSPSTIILCQYLAIALDLEYVSFWILI